MRKGGADNEAGNGQLLFRVAGSCGDFQKNVSVRGRSRLHLPLFSIFEGLVGKSLRDIPDQREEVCTRIPQSITRAAVEILDRDSIESRALRNTSNICAIHRLEMKTVS